MQTSQTKIFLDEPLCNALLKGLKTTIRSSVNLDDINVYPDGFLLKKIDINQGALFNIEMKEICDILGGNELKIDFPYKMGEKIEIIEKETNQHRSNLILNSVYIQRFREITNSDAIKDGYSVYENEIEHLEDKYPGCDAELTLLEKDWGKLYENPIGINIWTWVFGFKFENNGYSSINLSEEQINQLLSIA